MLNKNKKLLFFPFKKVSLTFKITLWYTTFIVLLIGSLIIGTFFVSDSVVESEAKKRLIDEVVEISSGADKFTSYEDGVTLSVYDKDGNRLPFTCSDEVFWNIDGIIAYQYLQREVGRLLIHLEVDNSFINESIQNIQIEAEHMFYNCDVEVLIVDRIERTSSGKFRYFVQTIE